MKTLLSLLIIGYFLNCAQTSPKLNATADLVQMFYEEDQRLKKKYPNGTPPVTGDSSTYDWNNQGQNYYNSAQTVTYSDGYGSGYTANGSTTNNR